MCRAVAPLGLPGGFCPFNARPGGVTNVVLEESRSSTEGQAGTRRASEVALKRRVDPGVAARYSNSCDDEAITCGEKLLSKLEALGQEHKSEEDVAPPILQRLGHGLITSKSLPPAMNRSLTKEAMEAVNVMKMMKTTRIMRASHVARKPAARTARRRPAPGARRRPAAACRR